MTPDGMDIRRKRLMFRCLHMGTAENDLLFGGFAKAKMASLTDAQMLRLEILLGENDHDLYQWASGMAMPPKAFDHDVMKMLKSFSLEAAASNQKH